MLTFRYHKSSIKDKVLVSTMKEHEPRAWTICRVLKDRPQAKRR